VTCDEVRDAAAELVLGTLDGERRAAVVAHLPGCAACRADVEALADVADALWLAAPEAEPPAGFEVAVLRSVRGGRRRGSARARRLLAAAAAVLLLAAGVAAGSLRGAPATRQAAGPMLDTGRHPVGHAVVSGGDPAYVYVTVDAWGDGGDYVVEVIRDDGAHVRVAPIHLAAGRGSAGGPLPVPYGDVRAIWVTDAAHTEWCAFRLPG
jgi:hypothetical protein